MDSSFDFTGELFIREHFKVEKCQEQLLVTKGQPLENENLPWNLKDPSECLDESLSKLRSLTDMKVIDFVIWEIWFCSLTLRCFVGKFYTVH